MHARHVANKSCMPDIKPTCTGHTDTLYFQACQFTSDFSSSLLDDVLSAFHSPNAAGFSTTDNNAMKTTMTAPRGWNDDADDAASSSPMDADFRFENRGGAASAMGINVHDDVDAESRGKKKFFL